MRLTLGYGLLWLVSGVVGQDSTLYAVEHFGASSRSGRPDLSWLKALLRPSTAAPPATAEVETQAGQHRLYEISEFQSLHDRQRISNSLLARFTCRTARGGSSEIDSDSDTDDGSSSNRSPSSNHKPYSVTTTLVHGSGATSLTPGCDIIDSKQSVRLIALWQDNTPALWKTLAFLSDTLVVGLMERSAGLAPTLTEALRAGLVARKARKLPKPRLLFALHTATPGDREELRDWREQLVQQELSSISERLVDRLEIVGEQDLTRRRMKARKGGVSKIADAETFPRLVKQVHSSFGGKEQTIFEAPPVATDEPALKAPNAAPKRLTPGLTVSQAVVVSPKVARVDAAAVLEAAMADLALLEELQDEASLAASAGAMPFDFARHAAPILDRVAAGAAGLPGADRVLLQQQVGAALQRLFQRQLASVRDYYGRMYETLLDGSDDPREWRAGAARGLAQFRKAAAAAVPGNLRTAVGELDLPYLTNCAADGLRADMEQAAELRRSVAASESDGDGDEAASVAEAPRRSVPKWYKRLAARGLVLGINYFQGWLAWQGIKRAALQRERNLPKFPLF